jgi:hypothetical protein
MGPTSQETSMHRTSPRSTIKHRRAARVGLGAVAVAAGLAALPAAANAAVICRYDPALKVTQITLDGVASDVVLARSQSNIVFRVGPSTRNVACRDIRGAISSTVTNTDRIAIRGTEIPESFTIDLTGGAFAPGVATEATGTPEIELVLTTSSGQDNLNILGGTTNDTLRVGRQGSALLNGDTDIDLIADYDPVADRVLEVDAGGGNDFLSARGFAESGLGGANFPVALSGGDGKDVVIDGFGRPGALANDHDNDSIDGGAGDDLLFVDDGNGTDVVEGGAGDDKGFSDDSPFPTRQLPDLFARTEQITYTAPAGGLLVGKLKLAARTVTAGAAKTGVVGMSWTHPKSWKRLRTVTVTASDGANPIGKITIRPRSEKPTASGALKLVGGKSSVSHKGKTVTARLAIRTKPSLAGKTLRLDVEALARNGKKQLEFDAGTLRIAE